MTTEGKTKRKRVVDFSTHTSGPMACRHLASMGADIVKFERPGHGDGNRQFAPFAHGEGVQHLYLNAGARSVVMEPSSPKWKETISAVAKWADVVIVGARPSNAQKLGLDPASLFSSNRRLVYCLISGYGLTGPWANLPAHGLNTDALAGVVPIDWNDGVASIPEMYRSFGTSLAGLHAAFGIMAAMLRVSQTGVGQFVHGSIWESALSWMWRDSVAFLNSAPEWPSYDRMGPRYRVYKTKDDLPLLVCPVERHFWERFCDVVGLSERRQFGDWVTGQCFGQQFPDEQSLIQHALSLRTREEWIQKFGDASIPAAPLLSWKDVLLSEHARANGVISEFTYRGNTARVPNPPFSISEVDEVNVESIDELARAHARKTQVACAPPLLGEHTEEFLAELGLS